MEVKKSLVLLLVSLYFIISCSSQPTTESDDFAVDDQTASSDTASGQAPDSNENSANPTDEFGSSGEQKTAEENQQNLTPESEPQMDISQNQNDLNTQTQQPDPQMPIEPQQQVQAQPEPEPQPVQVAPVPVAEEAAPKKNNNSQIVINNLQFKGNETGGTLVIEANNSFTYTTRKNNELKQLIIEIPNSQLPKKLTRPLNMKDFKGGIASVDSYQNPGTSVSRFVVQLRNGTPEPMIQQEGNSLLVVTNDAAIATDQVVNTDSPLFAQSNGASTDDGTQRSTEQTVQTAANPNNKLTNLNIEDFLSNNTRFYGEEVLCNFDEMEVKEALQFIALEYDVNVILDEVPPSKVSLNLKKIPWDQCLFTIMRVKKLGYARMGNILRVAPNDVLKKEDEEAIKRLQDKKQIDPTNVRIYPLSFSDGADLVKQLDPFKTKDRGSISFDTRTNSLIIIDTDEVLAKMAILIKNLDVPPAQVLIEGKIVEANETYQKQLGINWGFGGQPISLSKGKQPVDFTPNFSLGKPNTSPDFGFGFTIGVIDILGNLSASLALLEKEDKVKVLSSPRLVTLNNSNAKISSSTDVPLVSRRNDGSISQGNNSKYSLDLDVTPQITNDGSVKMKIAVTRSYPGVSPIADLPAAATKFDRTVSTNVLVKNGQTSVIGGVFQNDTAEAEIGINGLKDIPVIGYLFRQKNIVKTNTELLIFLTPRILSYNDVGEVGKSN